MSKEDSSGITIENSIFDEIKTNTASCPAGQDVSPKKKGGHFSLASIILLITVIALSGVVFMERVWRKEEIAANHYDPNLCLSKACINTASQISSRMNLDVDPCENFHEYACGRWNKLNPIPEEYSRYTAYGKMARAVRRQVKDILEEKIVAGKTINKAKILYNSCVNLKAIDKSGIDPLKELLKEFKGGWPIINDEFKEKDYSFEKYMATINLYNEYALMDTWVNQDDFDNSSNIFQFDQAKTIMRPYRYTNPKYAYHLTLYRQLIVDVAMVMGADDTVAEKDAEEIVKFETEIAKLTPRRRRHYSQEYSRMTVSEMQKKFNNIEWLEYINELLKPVNHEVTDDTLVGIYATPYLTSLNELIKKTKKRTVANYIVWVLVRSSINVVAHRVFQPILQKYHGKLGFAAIHARWKYCTRLTNEIFPQLTGRQFIERFFDPKMKERVLDMIKMLTLSFTEMVKSNTWMDAASKENSIVKINKMEIKIGYEDAILNDEFLNKLYEDYKLVDGTFYSIMMTIKHKYGIDTYKKINDEHPTPRRSTYNPTTVNAYHNAGKNRITFPAGILQPPIYNKDYIRALNYGGIGVVIGHEITHGFDNNGRNYDGDGKRNEKIWPEKQIKSFQEKAMCYARQYDQFKHNGIHAYRKFVEKNGQEKYIPILKMNSNKMFYIGFGQVWCEKIRESRWPSKLRGSVHSPGVFRVLGSLQNSKKFAETFGCKKNSYMNPEKKCKIW